MVCVTKVPRNRINTRFSMLHFLSILLHKLKNVTVIST
nr:MAG TPA: hypothetical protein [Caudoviricetes sp.]